MADLWAIFTVLGATLGLVAFAWKLAEWVVGRLLDRTFARSRRERVFPRIPISEHREISSDDDE